MRLVPLNCNECGSKLKVAEGAKFVTCKRCEAQLAVVEGDGAMSTVLADAAKRVEKSAEALGDHVAELAQQNKRILLEKKLERLERAWDEECASMMVKSKDGSVYPPSTGQATGAYIGSGVMFVMGFFAWTTLPDGVGPMMLLIFGAGAAMLVLVGRMMAQRAARYTAARARHDSERDEILEKIAKLEAAE